MATYYRPNLTAEQRDLLLTVLQARIEQTAGITDPAFESLYCLLLRVRDTKEISTAKRGA
jgi:hypothetical protein